MADESVCSNPGCEQPGTNRCSACKTSYYCGSVCQTADWPKHKETCPGHLRKVGLVNLDKAKGFNQARNWLPSLRFSELALAKLRPLNDRSLAIIEILDDALSYQFNALHFLDRKMEALECATERYNLWANSYIRNPRTIHASFPLIDSLMENGDFERAHLIAGTVHEMIMHPTNHDIPDNMHLYFMAQSSHLLADSTYRLAKVFGIPLLERKKAGEDAIALARKALEIHTELHGADSEKVANDMGLLANVLRYFGDVNDEAIHLYEQMNVIFSQSSMHVGSSSVNVALNKMNLGNIYFERAVAAINTNDVDLQLTNYELAYPQFLDAAQIFRTINNREMADNATQHITMVESSIRYLRTQMADREAAAANNR